MSQVNNDMKNPIKLIATDIDGTLLDNAGNITKANLDLIERLAKDNIYVVLVSSRPLEWLPSDVLNSGHIKYSITSNGAVVYDHSNNKIIENNVIGKDETFSLLENVRKTKAILTVASSEGIMADRSSFLNIVASSDEEHAQIVKVFEDSRPVYDKTEFEDIIASRGWVEKVHLNYHSLEDKNKAFDYLESTYKNGEYHITSSHFSNIEITHKDASKYAAVISLAQELNIDSNNVLTIGDGQNDIGMFKVSKHSVAMLNGDDNVKDAANYITDVDNDNSGWSKFIAAYLYS